MSNVKCPKCSCIATPWGNNFYVCDCCGYGKTSTDKPIRGSFYKSTEK